MDLSQAVLGRSVVTYIQTRQRAPVLKIGRDRFADRAALSTVACFNFLAAARLSRILEAFAVKDTRDVFDRIHPDALAVPGLGAVSLAVLGAAFQAKRIGGETPLLTWFRKHETKAVTFHTIKQRDADERAKEKKETKSRRAARRNTAHAIRVNRLETRKDATL